MIILDRDNPLRNPDRAPFAQAIDRTIIVADFEFRANQEKYDKYLANDGDSAHKKPRWTFNDIVCAAWVVIRFPAGAPEPVVSAFHSFCAPEMDEIDILDTFFGVFEEENSEQPVPLVTWAGDFVDIAVLRHMAEEWDDRRREALRRKVEERFGTRATDEALVRAAVEEEALATGKANVSRAVSDLVKAGFVRRYYAGRVRGHQNRGGGRHAIYVVAPQVLNAIRSRPTLV